MAWLETVVCSSHKKIDARFLRTLNAHQELKRRQDGCLLAWAARSVDGQPLFLVQTLYKYITCQGCMNLADARVITGSHCQIKGKPNDFHCFGILDIVTDALREFFRATPGPSWPRP